MNGSVIEGIVKMVLVGIPVGKVFPEKLAHVLSIDYFACRGIRIVPLMISHNPHERQVCKGCVHGIVLGTRIELLHVPHEFIQSLIDIVTHMDQKGLPLIRVLVHVGEECAENGVVGNRGIEVSGLGVSIPIKGQWPNQKGGRL